MEFITPEFNKDAFTCPECLQNSPKVKKQLFHTDWNTQPHKINPNNCERASGVYLIQCTTCDGFTVWFQNILLFPRGAEVEPMPKDLPDNLKYTYIEAADVLTISPTAAIMLLRSAIEQLCFDLGGSKYLNKAIGNMVKNGLPEHLQKALDVIRITGNLTVHNKKEYDLETAIMMFKLLHRIVEVMITFPKDVDEM